MLTFGEWLPIIIFIAIICLAKVKKISIKGYLIIAFIVGITWEVVLQPFFNYRNWSFYLYLDVPLILLLFWVDTIIASIIITRFILKAKGKEIYNFKVIMMYCMTFFVLGNLSEILYFKLGYWTYHPILYHLGKLPLTDIPTTVVIVYFAFGLCVITMVRLLGEMLEGRKSNATSAGLTP
ncbi:MAG TPA: hypothetical protein EYP60_03175 [bacterium (Candidatus Stahlbacteria)]|nr:hypothetical protein [Candidatus Stahlbacteria bacterium]